MSSAQEHDGGLVAPRLAVLGGSGGSVAHLADLEVAETALRAAAAELDDAAGHGAGLTWVVERAQAWSPVTAGAAADALAGLVSGRSGLRSQADHLRDTADRLHRAAEAYRTAEGDAHRRMVGVSAHAGRVLGDGGPVGWLLGAASLRLAAPLVAWGVLSGAVRPQRLAEHVVAGTSGVLVGALPGQSLPNGRPVRVAAGIADLVLERWRPPTRLEVRRLADPADDAGPVDAVASGSPDPSPRGGAPQEQAPRDVGDVLRLVADTYSPDPEEAGAVEVRRLTHPDGTTSWVVAIPGTQSAGVVDGPVPADMGSNLQLVGGRPDDVTALVVAAMRDAGVRPGEPVLLAGHSQGGLAAMAVAASTALREEFTVAAVVTAGSPVAGMPLPPDVQALHLEHAQDYVPSSEGAPNPHDPNRTTVLADVRHAPAARDRAAAGDPTAAHDVTLYARTGEEVARVDHPSLSTFDAALRTVLGDGSATAEAHRWVGRRVPTPPPPP